jgi:hypothetical protein
LVKPIEHRNTNQYSRELRIVCSELDVSAAMTGRLIGSVGRGVGREGDLVCRIEQALLDVTVDTGHHVMLPGMKQRMAIVSFAPSQTCIGHTMVRPSRFGSLIIASSGTSYQLPSMRTR